MSAYGPPGARSLRNSRDQLVMRGHANLSALVAMKRFVAVIDQQNSIGVRQQLRCR